MQSMTDIARTLNYYVCLLRDEERKRDNLIARLLDELRVAERDIATAICSVVGSLKVGFCVLTFESNGDSKDDRYELAEGKHLLTHPLYLCAIVDKPYLHPASKGTKPLMCLRWSVVNKDDAWGWLVCDPDKATGTTALAAMQAAITQPATAKRIAAVLVSLV